jgi:hypothetical protein
MSLAIASKQSTKAWHVVEDTTWVLERIPRSNYGQREPGQLNLIWLEVRRVAASPM